MSGETDFIKTLHDLLELEKRGTLDPAKAEAVLREKFNKATAVAQPEFLHEVEPPSDPWAKDFVGRTDLAKGFAIDHDIDSGKKPVKYKMSDAPAKAIAQMSNCKKDPWNRPIRQWSGGVPYTSIEPVIIDQKLDEIQAIHDQLYMVHSILRRFDPDYREAPRRNIKKLNLWRRYMKAVEPIMKTTTVLDSTTSGEGDEWVPTGMSSRFIDSVYLEMRVASQFAAIEMPTQPFDVPGTTSLPMAFSPAEGVAPSSTTNVASSKRTLTAHIFKSWTEWTDELEEDSIIAVLPLLQRYHIQANARAVETAVINGDSGTTHMDYDVAGGAADLPQKTFDGLRALAMDNSHSVSLSQTNPMTWAIFSKILPKMGAGFAEDVANQCYITGTSGWTANLRRISEVLTLQNFGADALIKTGAVGMIEGKPVILSGEVPVDLHDTGYNTVSGDNDTTVILLVHKQSFATGYRRRVRVETDKTITTSVNDLVVSSRFAFVDLQDCSSLAPLSCGYDAIAS